jgi:monoterpene epsilon-lactone hydrolase
MTLPSYANPRPVSIRARLLRPLIRLSIGRAMRSTGSFDAQRRQLLRAGGSARLFDVRGTRIEAGRFTGLPTLTVRPPQPSGLHLLYLHGGGYAVGAASLYRSMASRIALLTGAVVTMPDYRLAPEHPFPAGLDDALAAYRALLDSGIDAGRIFIGGDSAGGGLSLACALAARDTGLPQPGGLVCLSPWTDLSVSGDSVRTNRSTELVLAPDSTERFVSAYLGQRDARTPLASPLFADLRGLAPTLIQVSGHEILFDDSTRFAAAAQSAGVAVGLQVWDGVWHVWQAMPKLLPEADAALSAIAAFMQRSSSK